MDLATLVYQAFEGYRLFQQAHPVLGTVLTAQVVFPFADISSQLITDKCVDWKKVTYTAGLAPLYGLCGYALMESGNLVGQYIIDHPLAQAALGPNLWGNLFNTFFFVNNSVGERNGYSLKKLGRHYWSLFSSPHWKNIKDDYLSYIPLKEYLFATAATLTVWNAFQYWNYASVPKELQIPVTFAASAVWTVLLSLLSLNGRRNGRCNV